jgi:kynurenine formamidase
MKIELKINGKPFIADFGLPLSIGIPLSRENNPGCYYTNPPEFKPIMVEGFTGSIAEGGTVNHFELSLAPHGNGTHTECSGHIYNNGQVITDVLAKYHFLTQVVSISPTKQHNETFVAGEAIDQLNLQAGVTTMVIRTLPNTRAKLSKDYSGTNPTYISVEAMEKIVAQGIEHLIVDVPSVDPEVDAGKLSAHKSFWQGERQNHCTITELAYMPNDLADGLYLLNLQIMNIELDVSPSNPVLYSLKPM